MRAFRIRSLSLSAVAFAAALSAIGPARAADAVPHHEHVALYENCVASLMQQLRDTQRIIAQSLCMCQSALFVKNHTFAQLEKLAKSPVELQAAAKAYMDVCTPEVREQLKLR